MFLPDVFTYIIPYLPFQNILQDILVITPEQLNPNILDTITTNVGLLAGFIASITVIGGIMITVGVWLRKTVTKENMAIRKETAENIERVKTETALQIKDNRSQIENVKTILETKIDSTATVITNTLVDQKDAMLSIKRTIEKVDDKLERNVQGYIQNKTRINTHEGKIDKIEDRMYSQGGYDDSLRRLRRKGNIDSRYSLAATGSEVDEEHMEEGLDEDEKNEEQKRRNDSHK